MIAAGERLGELPGAGCASWQVWHTGLASAV